MAASSTTSSKSSKSSKSSSSKVKIRKHTVEISSLSSEDKHDALIMYIDGTLYSEIAERFNVNRKSLEKYILSIKAALNNRAETNAIIYADNPQSKRYKDKYKAPSSINESFLSLLSPDEPSAQLTDQEYTYAYIYTETLDPIFALQESTLDAGILTNAKRPKDREHKNYKSVLLLRHRFLMNKSNVALLLDELREKKFVLLSSEMSPERLQAEHINLLEAAKSQGKIREATTLLRNLGETISLYKQRIEVDELNPSKALDLLISKAKQIEKDERVEQESLNNLDNLDNSDTQLLIVQEDE